MRQKRRLTMIAGGGLFKDKIHGDEPANQGKSHCGYRQPETVFALGVFAASGGVRGAPKVRPLQAHEMAAVPLSGCIAFGGCLTEVIEFFHPDLTSGNVIQKYFTISRVYFKRQYLLIFKQQHSARHEGEADVL